MLTEFINFFIASAHADTVSAAAAPGGGGFSFFILPAVFLLFFYFVLWRPQSKRAKEQRNMLGALAKGDEIVTAGGILARVVKIQDQYLLVALSDNVEIVLQKSSIVNVLPKGTLKSVS